MSDLVVVTDLRKTYPGGGQALAGVSFRVAEGQVFGFLGPNGSGKTTTIRILVTLMPSTGGTVLVGGHDVSRDADAVRRLIGYAAQHVSVDDDLTARENLVLQGRLHGIGAREARVRTADLLDVFGLAEFAGRRASSFSGGMRRRLDLAQALVHRPPLLFLDEPTTGLDPQSRAALWEHLEQLNRNGTTIFLTTQYLEEADRLCHQVAIIDLGQVVASGSPAALKAQVGSELITVRLAGPPGHELRARAEAALAGCSEIRSVAWTGDSLSLSVADAAACTPAVVRCLDSAAVPMLSMTATPVSLDDVFLTHTGRRTRPDSRPTSPFSSVFASIHAKRNDP